MQHNIQRLSCGENKKLEARAAEILSQEPEVLFCAIALHRVLRVYNDRCTITRDNSIHNMVVDPTLIGTRTFSYELITSLQYSTPSLMMNGAIEFEYPGATKTEYGNRFIYTKAMMPVMNVIHKYLAQRIDEARAAAKAPAAPAFSAADELLKFKQLLDMGAITQAEFDQKKRELLG